MQFLIHGRWVLLPPRTPNYFSDAQIQLRPHPTGDLAGSSVETTRRIYILLQPPTIVSIPFRDLLVDRYHDLGARFAIGKVWKTEALPEKLVSLVANFKSGIQELSVEAEITCPFFHGRTPAIPIYVRIPDVFITNKEQFNEFVLRCFYAFPLFNQCHRLISWNSMLS